MASTDVTFDILARDRASRVFNQVGRSALRTESTFKRVGRSMARVGRVAALGLAAGAGAAALGLKASISEASDLNETITKTGQVLGKEALPGLERFAEAAARNLGQSKRSALDAVATFAIFGKSAGLRGKELSGFSTELTKLAGDMASFSNTSPEDAITAIGAALRGEQEPIRRYGVLLDDASLRQEALKQGLIDTTSQALKPQQRVLAAQALILQQTSDAQGDFARTSDGLANQQRILRAQFDNTKATLGRAFLPLAQQAVSFLNERALPAFQGLIDALQGKDVDAQGGLARTAGRLGTFLREQVLPALRQFAGFVREEVVPQLRELGRFVAAEVVPRVRELGRVFLSQVVPALVQMVRNAAPGVKAFLGDMRDLFRENEPTIRAVGKVLLFLAGKALPELGRQFGRNLRIAGKSIKVFIYVVKTMTKPIYQAVDGVIRAIGGILRAASKIPGPFGEKMGKAADAVDRVRDRIKSTLAGLEDDGRRSGSNFGAGFTAGVRSSLAGAESQVRASANRIAAVARATFEERSPSRVGVRIGRFFMDGITLGLSAGEARAIARTKQVTKGIIDAARDALSAGRGRLRDLQDRFKSVVSGVADSVRGSFDVTNAPGIQGIKFQLGAAVGKARRFAAALAKMAKRRVPQALIAQIAQAGPDGGMQAALALANASGADLSQVRSQYATLNRLGTAAGRTVAGNTSLNERIREQRRTNEKLEAVLQELRRARRSGQEAVITERGGKLIVRMVQKQQKKDRRRG
jgi:hypothetical protein